MTTMLPQLNLIIFGNFYERGFGAKAIVQPAGGFHCLLRFQAPSPAKSVSMYTGCECFFNTNGYIH